MRHAQGELISKARGTHWCSFRLCGRSIVPQWSKPRSTLCLPKYAPSTEVRKKGSGLRPMRRSQFRPDLGIHSETVVENAVKTASPPTVFDPPSILTPVSANVPSRTPELSPAKTVDCPFDSDINPDAILAQRASLSQSQPVQEFLGSLMPRLDDKIVVFDEYGIRTQAHLRLVHE